MIGIDAGHAFADPAHARQAAIALLGQRLVRRVAKRSGR